MGKKTIILAMTFMKLGFRFPTAVLHIEKKLKTSAAPLSKRRAEQQLHGIVNVSTTTI